MTEKSLRRSEHARSRAYLHQTVIVVLMLMLFAATVLIVTLKPLWLLLGALILAVIWCFSLFFQSWPYSLYMVLIGFWLGS